MVNTETMQICYWRHMLVAPVWRHAVLPVSKVWLSSSTDQQTTVVLRSRSLDMSETGVDLRPKTTKQLNSLPIAKQL